MTWIRQTLNMPCTKERVREMYRHCRKQFLEPLGKQVKLSFNGNKTRAGVCFFSPLEIQISTFYIRASHVHEDQVINTILHEMAHAIAGPDAGHGAEWRRVALSIGCDAKRCVDSFVPPKHYRYVLDCGQGCVMYRHRTKKGKLYVCSSHQRLLKLKLQTQNVKKA